MPSVVLVTEPFERVARASAEARAAAKLPIVVLPSDFDELDAGLAARVLDDRLSEIVDSLTRSA